MNKLKKIINLIHLYLGLTTGIIVVIVALTGCIVAFEDEIRDYTHYNFFHVAPQNQPIASVEEVSASFKQAKPKNKLTQIRFYGEAGKTIHAYSDDKKVVAMNPYTASVVSEDNPKNDWLYTALQLHRNLLLGKIGKEIIYWNTIIFMIMVVSGIVLWFPVRWRQWRFWKQVLTIKTKAPFKKVNYDLHSVSGFYACIFLFIIALSGISIAGGITTEKKITSTVQINKPSNNFMDDVILKSLPTTPYEEIRLYFPKDSLDVIKTMVLYPTNSFRKLDTYTFDQYTGQVLKTDFYKNWSAADTFWASDYEIHTGRIWGLPGKILVFLLGLVAAAMPITGFIIWWGKRTQTSKQSIQQPLMSLQNQD